MRNQNIKQNRAEATNWREIGNGFLLAVIMIFIFVVLNGMGGK